MALIYSEVMMDSDDDGGGLYSDQEEYRGQRAKSFSEDEDSF